MDEDVAVAEGEEVGTLPHATRVQDVDIVLRAGDEGVEVIPMAEVGGAVEENRATLAADAGAEGRVPEFAFAPGSGVAKAGDVEAGGRSGDDGCGLFGEGGEMGTGGEGETLRLAQTVCAVADGRVLFGSGDDTGIEKRDTVAVRKGRTGPATVSIGTAGRGSEGDG